MILLQPSQALAVRDSAYLVEPPPGQVRTFGSDRPTLAPGLVVFGCVITVVAAVAVLLRIYTRTFVVRNAVSGDDYLAVASLCFSITLLGFLIKMTTLGMGNHMWDVPLADYSPYFLLFTICATICYALSISFSKLSILAFYLRLSPARWFRVLVWTLVGVVSAYSIAYLLVSIFGCTPVAASWDLSISNPTCVDTLTSYMVLSIANIIMDCCTLALPMPVVLPLQMARRQKASLILLFAAGGLVCAIAIPRTVILPPLMASPDYTRDAVEQFYWCFAEVNVGIICAAAPALKPFFVRHLPALSYELRDRPESAGDEAKLWPGGKTDQDASSVESRHTVVVSTGGRGDGEGQGINVVKETTVDYVVRWVIHHCALARSPSIVTPT